MGRMVVALYNETPVHRDAFLRSVRERYYDSTLIHRAIPEFLIQGGDPTSRTAEPGAPLGNGGPEQTLPAEPHPRLHPVKGALAAVPATTEPAADQTHGSQFFFVVGRTYNATDLDRLAARRKDTEAPFTPEAVEAYTTAGGLPHMDGHYTVFGEVLEGLEVLDLIANTPCNQQDRPITDVRIWMRELP